MESGRTIIATAFLGAILLFKPKSFPVYTLLGDVLIFKIRASRGHCKW